MFLNYSAGVLSLVLAISSFVPWVTVWFYSLKGIESTQGIAVLVAGLLGLTVAAFQHLSGKMRGLAFIAASVISLACEAVYVLNLRETGRQISSIINDILTTLNGLFGERIMSKIREVLGEQMTKFTSMVVENIMKRAGIDTHFSGLDFIGGGLILAVICSLSLLAVGIILEIRKPMVD